MFEEIMYLRALSTAFTISATDADKAATHFFLSPFSPSFYNVFSRARLFASGSIRYARNSDEWALDGATAVRR